MFRPIFALAVALTFATTATAAVIVDEYQTPSSVFQANVGSDTDSPGVVGADIFGTRTLTTTNLAGNPPDATSSIAIGGGFASISTSVENTGAVQTLAYDFSQMDFTANNAVHVLVSSFNDASGAATVEAYIDDVSSGLQFLGSVPIAVGDLSIPFGGADRDQVTGLSIVFRQSLGDDVRLSSDGGGIIINGVVDVPEPTTLATLGLMGLVGGAYARRRLKAQPTTTTAA